jgi:hypothetical protein
MTFVKAYIGETPLFEAGSAGATILKTGQTVSYAAGDDGDLEAGRAVDFFTLATNNPFGNTNRFTALDGSQTYTNDIIIDWSTFNGSNVLGYYNGVISNRTWPDAIAFANALTINSYSNWRLTNRNELLNLCLYEGSQFVFNYPPFSITTGTTYWTSTTVVINSVNAYTVSSGSGISRDSGNKTDGTVARTIFCRTFTVTGTTLT